MEQPSQFQQPTSDKTTAEKFFSKSALVRWGVVLLLPVVILLIPVPPGITPQSWRLLAIFAATIMGSILQPLPGSAMVLLGVTALSLFKVMTIEESLTGYADPVVWLVLAAFLYGYRYAYLIAAAIAFAGAVISLWPASRDEFR